MKRLVKLGAISGTILNNKVSFKDCLDEIREEYKTIDINYVNLISPGRYFTEFYNNFSFRDIYKFKCNKETQGIILRIISGYTFTNKLKNKIRIADSGACNFHNKTYNYIFWA